MNNFPAITWLTEGQNFSDYRPTAGPDGQTILFERTNFPDAGSEPEAASPTVLYQLNIGSSQPPVPFLPAFKEVQTRPDWCWQTNQVVFNNNSVWIVDGEGGNPVKVPGSTGCVYAQWSADGSTLTVMNGGDAASPNPCTTVMNTAGVVLYANINGIMATGPAVFGGMPAVNPLNSLLVAFAGQPVLPPWGQQVKNITYNQTNNYIFINSGNAEAFASAPLEAGATAAIFNPAFQGRAPAWSPDGRYIVFESTRIGNQFALFLFDTQGNGPAVQLTDTQYQVQHAKFFPDGKSLLFCGRPNARSRNRIGMIGISEFVG